jgi:hypothetical protein
MKPHGFPATSPTASATLNESLQSRINLLERAVSRRAAGLFNVRRMTQTPFASFDEPFGEQHQAALAYLTEAFAEAILAGVESDSFAQAALSAALRELVATYGEETVAKLAEALPGRIRAGEFTLASRH